MKKLTLAFGAAALLSLAALSAPAQAQAGGRFIQTQVYVVPAPPPPPRHHYYVAPPPPHHYYGPRYSDHDRYEHRHRRWEERRHGRRDYDGDGVPNRYDRRPENPYRY
ncbi:hypothetical protein ASC78_22150 [Variovorax sp. Root318D1]|uniref:hypothetical protein n=1 Tax=Variovorax sp. Root318D1 TaxID=1736513 RepID=UPI0006FDCE17|nr:hypothetical protein [Variovorax sp. Root318D1]KQU89365.1 hypothetical protein ASC78_22150 [Variovorax sp. Root318D1]